jgi:hypothetical protein
MTDNELVAQFMGIKVRYSGPVLYKTDEDGYIDYVDGPGPYWPDIDWQQLMSVVEKIYTFECAVELKIMKLGVILMYEDKEGKINCFEDRSESLIKDVYGKVIQFIKWYNEQNVTLK